MALLNKYVTIFCNKNDIVNIQNSLKSYITSEKSQNIPDYIDTKSGSIFFVDCIGWIKLIHKKIK